MLGEDTCRQLLVLRCPHQVGMAVGLSTHSLRLTYEASWWMHLLAVKKALHREDVLAAFWAELNELRVYAGLPPVDPKGSVFKG